MDPKTRVYDIVKDFSTAMLVTRDVEKKPESRPMQIAKVEEGGDIWFFTRKNGRVVEELGKDPMVLLSFQDERNAYVSLRGKARVVKDRSRAKELWNEAYRVWFPQGVDDPELSLLAVDPVSAEYWDSRGLNKLDYLFEAAKAYVKGEKPPIGDPDQHGMTDLNGARIARSSEATERGNNMHNKYARFVGVLAITAAAVGLIINMKDVVRYVRISSM